MLCYGILSKDATADKAGSMHACMPVSEYDSVSGYVLYMSQYMSSVLVGGVI